MLEFGKVKPMLCSLRAAPLDGGGMCWERKYDGFRALAFVNADGSYRLQARSLTDKTALFPELKFGKGTNRILDGEITCGEGPEAESFTAVQHRVNNPADVLDNVKTYPAWYQAFDIIEVAGISVWHSNLLARKSVLQEAQAKTANVTVVPWWQAGQELWTVAKQEGWEGIVGKDLSKAYEFGKRHWVKVKTWLSGWFDVIGYTPGTGKRANLFGALVLANGTQVGSGFTDAELAKMLSVLQNRRLITPLRPGGKALKMLDVAPFSVKVKYVEVTNDGQLRFPIFQESGVPLC